MHYLKDFLRSEYNTLVQFKFNFFMRITRQLRIDALAADGTAPIQFTII
jgi:hypothetical protein